jgi:N-acylglucosamine 2-epimerase
MTSSQSTDFKSIATFHRQLLLENILPWWLRHAMDPQGGGLCSCIADDGTILSHEKYIWSQVRGLWTFAAAYRRVHPDPAYLEAAENLLDFCLRFGRNSDGDWIFRVDRDGRPLEGPESIQTDAYAICALVEFAHIGGKRSDEALAAARQTFMRTLSRIRNPGSYKTKPYPMPEGTKAQRVSMQFSLSYWDLGKLTCDTQVLEEAERLSNDVLSNFWRPEEKAVLEYLSLDNSPLPPPAGTYTSPGHGIETAWFQIENLRHTGDRSRLGRAAEAMRWSLEKGWDPEHGGLFLGMDLHGKEPWLPNGDTKIWWPHCEALCGTLLAHEVTGASWAMGWYQRVLDWSLAHFPDHEHGEWRQRLDRTGKPITQVVALPVKDPFHLPRALIYAMESAGRLSHLPGT